MTARTAKKPSGRMTPKKAEKLADAIAFWLFDQSDEIIGDPETFSEALQKFLTSDKMPPA